MGFFFVAALCPYDSGTHMNGIVSTPRKHIGSKQLCGDMEEGEEVPQEAQYKCLRGRGKICGGTD